MRQAFILLLLPLHSNPHRSTLRRSNDDRDLLLRPLSHQRTQSTADAFDYTPLHDNHLPHRVREEAPHRRNSFTGDPPLRSHKPRRPRYRTGSNVILCRICWESIRLTQTSHTRWDEVMWQCVGDLVCVQDCGYLDLEAGHRRYIGTTIHGCFCEAQTVA